MTNKVREALEQEKAGKRHVEEAVAPTKVVSASFTTERVDSKPVRDDVPFLEQPVEFISDRLEYLLQKSLDRLEQRRSTPEGRASVERENEQALNNYLDRPLVLNGGIEPLLKTEIQERICGLSEQFLAQQSIMPKAQNGRER